VDVVRTAVAAPSTRSRRPVTVDAADLGVLQRQVVHQALLIEDEPDDRARDAVGMWGKHPASFYAFHPQFI
jgi:hypothetical protein